MGLDQPLSFKWREAEPSTSRNHHLSSRMIPPPFWPKVAKLNRSTFQSTDKIHKCVFSLLWRNKWSGENGFIVGSVVFKMTKTMCIAGSCVGYRGISPVLSHTDQMPLWVLTIDHLNSRLPAAGRLPPTCCPLRPCWAHQPLIWSAFLMLAIVWNLRTSCYHPNCI